VGVAGALLSQCCAHSFTPVCPLAQNNAHRSTIRIRGSEVIPIPLFHTLDGTRSEDYVARVEPSASGGRKMAEYILDAIHSPGNVNQLGGSSVTAPSTSFIDGRAT